MNSFASSLLKWFGLPIALLISISIGNFWWPFNYVAVILAIATAFWVLILFIGAVRNSINEFIKTKKNKNK